MAPGVAALRPDVLWSSDLTRAATTAAAVAEASGLEVRHDARLREYDVGERAGLTIAEFAAAYPAEHARVGGRGRLVRARGRGARRRVDRRRAAAGSCPPCARRSASVEPGGTACVVGHGAALKVATVALLGWDRTASTSLRGMDNCGHTVLDDAGPEGRCASSRGTGPPISHPGSRLANILRVVRRSPLRRAHPLGVWRSW